MGIRLALFLTLVAAVAPAVAQDNVPKVAAADPLPANAADPLDGGDGGDELLLFEEMPIVVSASRQAQPMNWLSVPVSLVTADDLHYSGLTSLPDILQFVPGVDVLQVGRHRWAVGVRGLHEVYSDRLLTLVDGRPADSVIMGGADFPSLPTLLEDIERVEIVRGPGGGVWGANAFTGVVNIITKDPKDTQGWLLSTTWNHVGDSMSHVRYGGTEGDWRYRVSAGYEGMKSSEDAIHDDDFTSHDFSRNWRFDAKAIRQRAGGGKWSLGWGQSHMEYGTNVLPGIGKETGLTETGRGFVRYDHTPDDETSAYVQWYGNVANVTRGSTSKHFTAENGLEAQFNFAPAQGHRTSIGGNLRWAHINRRNSNVPRKRNYTGTPYNEFWAGAFITDRFESGDHFAVEAQLRGDWYSETHCDWSSRLTGLYSLDDDRRHVVRLSGAKAFRAPLAVLRKGTGLHAPLPTPPFPPGLFAVNLLRPRKTLKNEETWSVETGYTGKITPMLTVRADAYYQRFEKLIGFETLPDPLGMGRFFAGPTNVDGADSWGAETEVALKGKKGKLSAWYAYNAFQPDWTRQTLRAYTPATHKAGLTGRLHLPDDWTVNSNYRYTTVTSGHHFASVASSNPGPTHRLDLAVAKKVFQGNGEVLIGVSDLLNKTNDGTIAADGGSGHDVPGRMFFLRFQWNR